MSYVNVWMAIPEADHNELNNVRGDFEGVSPIVVKFVRRQLDPRVIDFFQTRTAGPNSWKLWSIYLDGDIISQVNDFRQQYPGAQVLGAWNMDGSEYGKTREFIYNEDGTVDSVDSGTAVYDQSDTIPAYMPGGVVQDINLAASQEPRTFTV